MPFKKGQSGNPGGKTREHASVEALARKLSRKAMYSLAAIMEDEDETGTARVAAANAILDRAFGKAKQSSDVTVSGHIDHVHQIGEALRMVEDRRRQMIDVTPEPAGIEADKPAAGGRKGR